MKGNRVALIIANIGVILIILGLGIQMIQYQERIDDLTDLLNRVATENTKLKAENESLWDNYYMNVTNQEGYEYYEW